MVLAAPDLIDIIIRIIEILFGVIRTFLNIKEREKVILISGNGKEIGEPIGICLVNRIHQVVDSNRKVLDALVISDVKNIAKKSILEKGRLFRW